jgi:hypothetical protein
MAHERQLFKIGGISAMLGVGISIFSTLLGPLGLESHDMEAVLQEFAAHPNRLQMHGLGVSLGALLMLGGFVALRHSFVGGAAAAWARLGMAAAIVETVIHLIGAMMGGSVMPALAESFTLASVELSSAAMQVGGGFYVFYEALLAPTFLTLAATILTFSIATLLADHYPSWLGWAGLVTGIWAAIGGVAFIWVGPIGAADIMLLFVPGFMGAIVWVFVIGIHLVFLQKEKS